MSSEISNVVKLSPVTVVKAEKQTEPRVSSSKEADITDPLTVPGSSRVSGSKETEAKAKVASEERSNASRMEVKKAIEEGNSLLQVVQRNLQFKLDDDTKELVVKVVDSESGEIVRQVPSDEMLAIIKRMKELQDTQGVIIRDQA